MLQVIYFIFSSVLVSSVIKIPYIKKKTFQTSLAFQIGVLDWLEKGKFSKHLCLGR